VIAEVLQAAPDWLAAAGVTRSTVPVHDSQMESRI